jgi:hypothetical protein
MYSEILNIVNFIPVYSAEKNTKSSEFLNIAMVEIKKTINPRKEGKKNQDKIPKLC